MTAKHSNPNSSTKKASWLVPSIALIILLLMVAWLAGFFNEQIAPETLPLTVDSQINKADTFIVQSQLTQNIEGVAASLVAKQGTTISSRMLARVAKVNVRAGDDVKQGDILIELEKSDLLAQVKEAEQQITAINARVQEAQANFERAKELFEKKIASAFDLDKAKANFDSISAELTAAEQSKAQAVTALSYATIKSPISGKVVDRFTEPGNTAQPGTKLLALYNPVSLRVEAQVREAVALTLQPGQTINVELLSLMKVFQGKVEEIVPAANTGSRSFLVKVSIDYQQGLLPGMYARMLIPADFSEKITIPTSSITQIGQLDFVWLVENGIKQKRFIRVGNRVSVDQVNVISGLSTGETILLNET